EAKLVQLQGVRQRRGRFEGIGANAQHRGQVLGQWLQRAAQVRVEITAAGGLEVEGLLQVALGVQPQLPGPAIRGRQLQRAAQLQRPVALRLEVALQAQVQLVALQLQGVDAQAFGRPVRGQLQVAQQIAAIEAQLADLDFAQLDGQRQTQRWQLQRAAVRR